MITLYKHVSGEAASSRGGTEIGRSPMRPRRRPKGSVRGRGRGRGEVADSKALNSFYSPNVLLFPSVFASPHAYPVTPPALGHCGPEHGPQLVRADRELPDTIPEPTSSTDTSFSDFNSAVHSVHEIFLVFSQSVSGQVVNESMKR